MYCSPIHQGFTCSEKKNNSITFKECKIKCKAYCCHLIHNGKSLWISWKNIILMWNGKRNEYKNLWWTCFKHRMWISFPEPVADLVLVLTPHISMGAISIYKKTNVVTYFSWNLRMDQVKGDSDFILRCTEK